MLGLLALAGARLTANLEPTEIVEVRTVDGWTNDLRHYRGEGPPVLLVHGMGANHYNFDWREEVSLADALLDAGWDVWVPELRGDPGSVPPERRSTRSYTFDDHARLDIPAAVREVLSRSGHDQLYWVGHSMGGMLLYTELATEPDKLAAGVAICSPSTFSDPPPGGGAALALGFAMGGSRRIPARALARATSPLGLANPMYGRLANRANLDPATARGLAHDALVDLTTPFARQGLGWLRSGEFTSAGGAPWLAAADVPLLVLGAPLDRIVGVANVASTCDVFPDCTWRLLAESEGFSTDYGHVDPVIGRNARAEVYPLVLDFLDAHR